jgi:hypothetical protein
MKSVRPNPTATLLALALVGLASACGAHLKNFYLPSGEKAYVVNCPGTPDVSDCYNVAHDTCDGPYYVFSENDDPMHREVTFSCPPKGAPAPRPMPPLVPR